jgi:hypothetical protein
MDNEIIFTEGEKQMQYRMNKLVEIFEKEIFRLNKEVENLKKWFINMHIDEITNKLDKLKEK